MKKFYREGDEGPEIVIIQEHLITLGYLDGLANGMFGELTSRAVKDFQAEHGLEVDGIVGKTTLKYLDIDLEVLMDGYEPPDRDDATPDLWYPNRVILADNKWVNKKMRTKGEYKNGYPEGAIVHYTAGLSRNREEGGKWNASTHFEQGLRALKYALTQNSYTYFLIARDGSVFQNFPLNRWGAHAGKSEWPAFGKGKVSSSMLGIEVLSAGKLEDFWVNDDDKDNIITNDCPKGYKAAWFSRPDKGNNLFDMKTEVRESAGEGNIQKGFYHVYSQEQERSLINLLLWLEENGNGIFSFDNVAGHDEVAPNRKTDPGACLSMSMNRFRTFLKEEKLRRGKIPSLHMPGVRVPSFD